MITFRRLRWLAVAAAIPALFACADHQLATPDPHPEQSKQGTFVQNPQLMLDIVFGIDNSDSMADKQKNLIANFPRFMQVLQAAVPAGSTLDAHIGVVSSDLGISSPGLEPSCGTTGGDNGAFQSAPRGACTGPTGSYIVSGPAGNNFTGSIEDTFSCIAALGVKGCGYEHQLASVRRALGGDPDVPAPPGNDGFLRSGARLGVILITDEDDCSAPLGSDLFTTDTSVYGPIDSYRCNEYGHLCGGAPPPRAVVSGLTCESNETDTGRLVKIADFVRFFAGLKPNPNLLRVAAITGPPAPYATFFNTTKNAIEISPSCSASVGVAAPAVRIDQFITAFGDRGLRESICLDDFGPAMEHIARSLVETTPPCVTARLYDTDLAAAGIQADCTVSEAPSAAETPPEMPVRSCDATGGTTPCWRLAADPDCEASSPDGVSITVDHGGTAPPPNTNTNWSCRVCPDPTDPACVR
jgi:hypothetical protein